MADVVAFPRLTASNCDSPSRSILPEWPHPRVVTLSIDQARAIDRDIRHLDDVMTRVNDTRTLSTIVSMICGADGKTAAAAARAINSWIRTGQAGIKV